MPVKPIIDAIQVGCQKNPIAVIDDFFPAANSLVSFAQQASFSPALNQYPGIRANLPDSYWSAETLELVQDVAKKVFSLSGKVTLIDSSFSIVTIPPEKLGLGQRLPHVDGFRSNQLALVHFLSPDIADGTAFYRHRATGLERLNEDLRHFYFRQIDQEIGNRGLPDASYISGDTPMFEQIATVSAKFNRAVLYFGSQLHSGLIVADTPLNPDPLKGRLTVTGFLMID